MSFVGAYDTTTPSKELALIMMQEHMKRVNPVVGSDAAFKEYLTTHNAASDFKESVRAASVGTLDSNTSITGSATYTATGGTGTDGLITGTLAASNVFTLDGVGFAAANNGDRIILKDQVTAAQNGIYVMTINGVSLSLDRAPDFNQKSVNGAGAIMFIEQGTVNGNQKWVFSAIGPIIVGGDSGDDIQFVKTSGSPTAANVGTGGQGFFKEMSGDEIRMRNINAATGGRIAISLDSGTDEIRVDVVEGSLDVTNMTGVLDATRVDYQEHSASSDTKSTTALTAFQNKATVTTATLQAGDYVVMYSADVGNATAAAKTVVRATIDASDASAGTYAGTGTDEFQSFSGFRRVTLTAATHTINIDYKAVTGTAEIQNARIELHRVA